MKKQFLSFMRNFSRIDPKTIMLANDEESENELKYWLGVEFYGKLRKEYGEDFPKALKLFYNFCKCSITALSDAKDLRVKTKVLYDAIRDYTDGYSKEELEMMKVEFQEYCVNKFEAVFI